MTQQKWEYTIVPANLSTVPAYLSTPSSTILYTTYGVEILPSGEPAESRNVVTYYLPGKNPEAARHNRIDYIFASRGFHESITVRAVNSVEEWGASDQCRLLINIADG